MTFKGNSDYTSLLHNLQHRRINEALSSHIPEDEAALLKNGRYTCLICSHRPIFDTLNVLSVHRRGKKHLLELAKYLSRKEELKELSVKKEHRAYLKSLSQSAEKLSLSVEPACSNVTRDTTSSPGLMKELTGRPLSAVLSQGCSKKGRSLPHQRKIRLHLDRSIKESAPVTSRSMPSTNSQVRHYMKGVRRKPTFEKVVERARENYSSTSCEGTSVDLKGQSSCSTDVSIDADKQKATEGSSSWGLPEDGESVKRADYYLKLRMAGWKKNAMGQWVKDEEAEFDSDEELPEEYSG